MNNYQIYEEIGKGRHSIVYKGRRKRSVEYYAISSIDKGQRPRVLNSVHFLRSIAHRNIIKFHGWYETNNHLWVITEYCTGGDLRSILNSQKRLSEKCISVLGADIANGLMHMHSQGVMYCDLKPSNVLLDSSAMLRFYDFGLAQTVESSSRGTPKVGTPSYMAPELFLSDGVHSFASDLWSLGVLLFELFVGAPPFVHTTLRGLMESISSAPFQRIPNASSAFNDLVEGLLQKDPTHRHTWNEVAASGFWLNRLDSVPVFPKHPEFASFTRHHCSKRDSDVPEASANRAQSDILRASINAERNLARELRAKGGYQAGSEASLGLKVDNEVDFREATCERDGDDSSTHASPASPAAVDGDEPACQTESSHVPPPRVTMEPIATMAASGADGGASSTGAKVPPRKAKPVEQLFHHPSDAHARPIVMNSRIERHIEPKFEIAELTFPARSVTQLRAMSARDLETFLTSVYRSLAAASPVLDKFNTLCYFESLCADTHLANAIINSSIMSLCVKMLHSNPMPSNIRSQLATVMGLLLRFATVIHVELRKTNIINVLMDTLEVEVQPRARRRVMACLGELLFYIATQSEEECGMWAVDGAKVVATYSHALRDPDEILRHIAVKAIENITSLDRKKLSLLFATSEFASSLMAVYCAPPQAVRSDHLRTSAFAAATKLAAVENTLVCLVMSHIGPENIGEMLCTASPRVIQALLTFVNLFLTKAVGLLVASCGDHHVVHHVKWCEDGGNESSKFLAPTLSAHDIQGTLTTILRHRSKFMDGLANCMDHSSAAIRGKAVLMVLLLTVTERSFLSPQSGDSKLFAHLEKLARDKDVYVVDCMAGLCDLFSFFVFVTVAQLAQCHTAGSIGALAEDLVVALHIFTSPSIRAQVVVDSEFIVNLSSAVGGLSQFAETQKYQENVFMLLEALSQEKRFVASFYPTIINSLLPQVATHLTSNVGEMRFAAVRGLLDLLTPIMFDNSMYDPSDSTSTTVPRLEDFIMSLQGLIPTLLSDTEPIPLYTLKLLSMCCDRSTSVLTRFATSHFVSTLIAFAAAGGAHKNNIYVLMLLLRTLQLGGEALILAGSQQGLITYVANELAAAAAAGQDQLLEACTEIVFLVLTHATRSVHLRADCVTWLHMLNSLLLPLCTHKQQYSECASLSVQKLAEIYPEARALLVDPSSLAHARQIFGDADQVVAEVALPLLQALSTTLSLAGPEAIAGLRGDDLLLVQLQALAHHSTSAGVASAAAAVLGRLREEPPSASS